MNDIEVRANRKFAAQCRAQDAAEQRGRVARFEEQKEWARLNRKVQWRTRFNAVERKLMEVQAQLRYSPQDQKLREECEKLEAMYKGLLEEAG